MGKKAKKEKKDPPPPEVEEKKEEKEEKKEEEEPPTVEEEEVHVMYMIYGCEFSLRVMTIWVFIVYFQESARVLPF